MNKDQLTRLAPFITDDPASVAHVHDWQAKRFSSDGTFPWRKSKPPTVADGSVLKVAHPFVSCSYCGSMHPRELVEALNQGATVTIADMKYGWPHKVYVDNAPNRYVGMMEIRTAGPGDYVGPEVPAPERTQGKFYTLHLKDCTPEQRQQIEQAIGLAFTFEGNEVSWKPTAPLQPNDKAGD